jgi:DMSO/TMAO reductase YedYZ molybdopterin-dependent catalytic subunit
MPQADGVDVRFEGADHAAYHLTPVLADTDRSNLSFVRALPLAQATDPDAGIVIAYEMNGEPLGPDHGAPFRIIVPHWHAVASVKWLKRIDVFTEPYVGESQTGHYIYQWADKAHEPVRLIRVRARITDPAPAPSSTPAPTRSAVKPGPGRGPSPASTSACPAKATGTRLSSKHPTGLTSGRTGPSDGTPSTLEGTRSEREPRTRRQRATGRPAMESPRLRKQRHRGAVRRRALKRR